MLCTNFRGGKTPPYGCKPSSSYSHFAVICEISQFSLFQVCPISPYSLRLSSYLLIQVREACTLSVSLNTDCTSNTKSRGSTAIHHNSSPHHNQSRRWSDAAKCTKDDLCFSRETPREDSGGSECATLCRQQAPSEGTANTSQDSTKKTQQALMRV